MKPKKTAVKYSENATEERHEKLAKKKDALREIKKLINFEILADKIDELAPRPMPTQGGRPPFPTELMIHILVLQQLYNLSDEAMEYQLLDRHTFQKFCGLENSSSIPDEKTIWFFKERINKEGGAEALFSAVNQQIEQQGYLARGGQLLDASLIPAPIQHYKKSEKEILKENAIPADWTPAKRRQKDLDASWTKKHGKSHHGYKLSVNADNRGKFIRKIVISTAKEHDVLHTKRLLDKSNTSKDVYGDKGYEGKEYEDYMGDNGFNPRIQHKKPKGKPQSECQKKRNTRISKTRVRVEHVFASIAWMGGKSIRTIGLKRAQFGLTLKATVYNMRRICSVKRVGLQGF
jgi:IS5 family transposase